MLSLTSTAAQTSLKVAHFVLPFLSWPPPGGDEDLPLKE